MEEEIVALSECLCSCNNEDMAPRTWKDRLLGVARMVVVGTLAVTFAALASIGLISVYLAFVLNT